MHNKRSRLPELVVWDWNGTLFDDVQACIDTANDLLDRHRLPRILSIDDYRNIFVFPVQEYYSKLGFDFNKISFKALAEDYMQIYHQRMQSCDLATGALEALKYFANAGVPQALVSASGLNSLHLQMKRFSLKPYFEEILGLSDILARGKQELASTYLNARTPRVDQVCFIGDTAHDFTVARACEAHCVLVANGHQSKAVLQKTGAKVICALSELHKENFFSFMLRR